MLGPRSTRSWQGRLGRLQVIDMLGGTAKLKGLGAAKPTVLNANH